MNLFSIIIIVIFALTYLLSPVDLIPDLLLPYLGYLDDLGIISTVIYILKYHRLPRFFPEKMKQWFNAFKDFYSKDAGNQAFSFFRQNSDTFSQSSSQSSQSSTKRKENAHTITSPYRVLGIAENATMEQVQSAYREAVKKYHPDKVSHLGPEFQELANKKFVEIQQAYDQLMRRG